MYEWGLSRTQIIHDIALNTIKELAKHVQE